MTKDFFIRRKNNSLRCLGHRYKSRRVEFLNHHSHTPCRYSLWIEYAIRSGPDRDFYNRIGSGPLIDATGYWLWPWIFLKFSSKCIMQIFAMLQKRKNFRVDYNPQTLSLFLIIKHCTHCSYSQLWNMTRIVFILNYDTHLVHILNNKTHIILILNYKTWHTCFLFSIIKYE